MLLFIDLEVSRTGTIRQIGGYIGKNLKNLEPFLYKKNAVLEFRKNILPLIEKEKTYVFGHNIKEFDREFLPILARKNLVDTLYLSALFFPKRPYHSLIKKYKEKIPGTGQIWNNPTEDSKLVYELIIKSIIPKMKTMNRTWLNFLLSSSDYIISNFRDFLIDEKILKNFKNLSNFAQQSILKEKLKNKVCEKSLYDNFSTEKIEYMIVYNFLYEVDDFSVPPKFLVYNDYFYDFFEKLVGTRCEECSFCKKNSLEKYLKKYFGYDSFRKFNGKDLQKQAVQKALNNEDFIVVFPTGGGKSLTFQLPALIKSESSRKLSVVISPLVSLMKDQVENLKKKGIANVAYLNQLQNSLEKAHVHKAIREGNVDILYIAPESLRSKAVKTTLSSRKIDRFIIDEAHCFSKWGHDFRVDYFFIGDFLKEIKQENCSISCFTATAKKQVLEDIQSYFVSKLGKNLDIINAGASRDNLCFSKIQTNKKEDSLLKILDEEKATIIFTNTTAKAEELAKKLNDLGIKALYYHGQMDTDQKMEIQDKFINGENNIIVATNAFGMGVDKDDVRYVIHYELPSSLENYLQEAGRAGRDGKVSNCIILYSQNDIDKVFQIQKMSEISPRQFKALFMYLKSRAKYKTKVNLSLATAAKRMDINLNEKNWATKIKVALGILEKIGFLERKFSSGKFMFAGRGKYNLEKSLEIIEKKGTNPELLKMLYTEIYNEFGVELNYLAETFEYENLKGKKTYEIVKILKQALDELISLKLLVLEKEYKIEYKSRYFSSPLQTIKKAEEIIDFILENNGKIFTQKQLQEIFRQNGILKNKNQYELIYSLITYLSRDLNKFVDTSPDGLKIIFNQKREKFIKKLLKYSKICIDYIKSNKDADYLRFLDKDLIDYFKEKNEAIDNKGITIVQEVLYFLHTIQAINVLDGLIGYEQILELEIKDPSRKWDKKFYELLKIHYKSKYQQAHILDSYVKMWKNSPEDKTYFENILKENKSFSIPHKEIMEDYFDLDIDEFLEKYFPNKKRFFQKPISEQKYKEIVLNLDKNQKQVIDEAKNLLIIAGPGAGKTKTLVHKIASMILQEGVKEEEFLMLTFSNSAKYEMKERLINLLGKSAYALDIHTFHSYAYKILGITHKTCDTEQVIKLAIDEINNSDDKIKKSVIVIDEYQDVNEEQFNFIQTIINNCIDQVRIIAAGDDDQNIYSFAGANIKYIQEFEEKFNAKTIFLDKNYRSKPQIVKLSEKWINQIENRKKKDLSLKSAYENTLFEESNVKILNYDGILSKTEIYPFEKNIFKQNTAYLCFENERASVFSSYLKGKNIEHKLISSKSNFAFYHLVEVNEFLKQLENKSNILNDKIFRDIFLILKGKFPNSLYLDEIKLMWDKFCSINKVLYKDSLEEFIYEWEMGNTANVFVGTLHKSKGKEFDNVILDLQGLTNLKKEIIHLIYVGLTRAKNNVYILTDKNNIDWFKKVWFSKVDIENINKLQKINEFDIYFGLEDVYIDFNKELKNSPIPFVYVIDDENISNQFGVVQKLSKKGIDKLRTIQKRHKIKKVDIYARLIYKEKYVNLPLFSILQ